MTERVVATREQVDQQSHALPRLHQPWRAIVALAEVACAALAVVGAFAVWGDVSTTITATMADDTTLSSQRYAGSLAAGAIVLGAVAAVLVVDAIRQVMLAGYARHRPPRRGPASGQGPAEEENLPLRRPELARRDQPTTG